MGSVALRNIRKSYGAVEVLHGIDFEIAEGEFTVLVGPSGCGKSTLLRSIAGLETISNGEIVGGSFSWGRHKTGAVKEDIAKLVEKTKTAGGLFQVSRIPLAERQRGRADAHRSAPAPELLKMLEEFMTIFEGLYTSQKTKDSDFNSVIRKKFVENAEQYAFLDPFAAEFEYVDRKIRFTGQAGDQELAAGVITSIQQLAQELGIDAQFHQHLISWSGKYRKRLAKLGIDL